MSESRPSDDPRARDRYGTATRANEDAGRPESRSADTQRTDTRDATTARSTAAEGQDPAKRPDDAEGRDADAGDADASLEEAAQANGNAALQPTRITEEAATAAAGDPTLAAQALQMVDATSGVATAADATPISAQIGAAAYRMGEHSQAEVAQAEARGIVLPGSTQERMLGQGVQDLRAAALQGSEQAAADATLEAAMAEEAEVLEPGKVAKDDQARAVSYREQIALQTAQNRNEVLARLTANGDQPDAASNALRKQMQLQGILARSARDHAVDHTAPNTPPTAISGAGQPAGSVNLTQVFEMPQDDAVQSRVLERVANEARWLIRNDRQEVSLRLNPEHLGSLHMKVTHQDGQYRVDLTVDNIAAKHLLESNLQDLRNRLVGENPAGQFMFNVDVRQGNQQPNLYSRAERTTGRPLGGVEALEQAPRPGLAARTMGNAGLSIYA